VVNPTISQRQCQHGREKQCAPSSLPCPVALCPWRTSAACACVQVEVCLPLVYLEATSGQPRALWRLKRELLHAADVIPSPDTPGAVFSLG